MLQPRLNGIGQPAVFAFMLVLTKPTALPRRFVAVCCQSSKGHCGRVWLHQYSTHEQQMSRQDAKKRVQSLTARMR
jgi:hypothetical protein